MPQKFRLEAEMKDNASPAVKRLRQELSDLQAASADTRGVTKLNAELAKLQSEAAANASPAVRKLRAELAELQKSTAAQQAVAALNKEIAALRRQSSDISPSAGMKAFGTWMGEAKGVAGGFMGAIGGLPSVLSAIGLGALGAGISASKLAEDLKRAGERALDLKELSRQTGMSKDFVNAWEHAGPHFNIAGEAMKGMLDNFSSQLPDFERGTGAMFSEFSRWPDTLHKIQEDIRQNNPAKALMDAMKQAEQAGKDAGPQVQKQLLESMGLGGDAEKLFGDGGLAGLKKELQKPWAMPSNDLTAQAQAYRDATIQFNNALQQFENGYGPKFLELMTHIVDDMRFILAGPTKDEQAKLDKKEEERRQGFNATQDEQSRRSREAGAKGERDAAPDMSDPRVQNALRHKSSFDGDDHRSLLRRASYTSDGDRSDFRSMIQQASFGGGTGSGTMEGAVSEGAKSGVLQAFREMMVEQDLKRRIGEVAGMGGAAGDGDPGGGGLSGSGHGRRGFSSHFEKDGGGLFGGSGKASAGALAKNGPAMMEAMQKQLIADGVSADHAKAAAAALMGNVVQESRGDPNTVHDGGTGYGIYGARLGRRDKMLAWLSANGFAKNDAVGQARYMAHEAMTDRSYAKTASALRAANQQNLGAVTDTVAKNFESPAPATANYAGRRNNAARAFGGDIGGGSGSGSDVGMHLQALNEQCVSLAKAAVQANGSVHEWRRGVGALAGTLKPGTPVATFLDAYGRKVERYANGGTGTPGAHLDHAGIFQSYIRDKAGAIIGMNIAEQYKGSHGVHSHAYFNKGWGERNASNYSAINGPDGQPLGGGRNPMNRRAEGLVAQHPNAGRRADRNLPSGGHAPGGGAQAGSEHSLAISFHDPGGIMKSHRLKTNGPLKIDVKQNWPKGRNYLLEA